MLFEDRLRRMLADYQDGLQEDTIAIRDAHFSTGERQDALVRMARTKNFAYSADHLARYMFAATLTSGQRVVDCACGPGYGSWIMAAMHGAKSVLGMDIDQATIDYALRYYGTRQNIEFLCGDARELSQIAPGDIDCVVSFETMEHLSHPEELLEQACIVLARKKGTLIVSSPPPTPFGHRNPYHLVEWKLEEFSRQLNERFADVTLFLQLWGVRVPLFRKLSRLVRPVRNWWMGENGGIYPLGAIDFPRRVLARVESHIAIARTPR